MVLCVLVVIVLVVRHCTVFCFVNVSMFSDTFQHRTDVRAALAKDAEWNTNYVKYLVQYVEKQENSTTILPQWCNLLQTDKTGGVV